MIESSPENPYASPAPAEDPPDELTETFANPSSTIRPTWWEEIRDFTDRVVRWLLAVS